MQKNTIVTRYLNTKRRKNSKILYSGSRGSVRLSVRLSENEIQYYPSNRGNVIHWTRAEIQDLAALIIESEQSIDFSRIIDTDGWR